MTAAYPIRAIGADEFPAFYAVIEHAFNSSHQTDAEMQHDLATFEFDRSLAAFDGADMVGTAGAFTFQMGVPGGIAPVAGVTAVAVLPSHRRRGILSSLMRRQLADVRERGETVAALFASETTIYGRYGYGVASAELDFSIRRGEGTMSGRPAAPGPAGPGSIALGQAGTTPLQRQLAEQAPRTVLAPGGTTPLQPPAAEQAPRTVLAPRLRSPEPRDAAAELAKVYDCVLRGRPGLAARDDRWWDYTLWDPEPRRSGSSPMRCVIAEDEAGPRGYALFSVKPEWGEHGIPGSVLRVQELMATDPAAHAAVWSDLLTRDLVAEVRARMRPADDPLLYLLADSRRARAHLLDGLWVRLVSVPGALTRRRYACAVDVVIDVADELFPENAGRWRLQAAGGATGLTASCERTSAPADVALPVRALGAAYLGGTRLGALAAAGLATETRPGALAALSAALSWDPAPWCPAIF